jgi:hypothetical protein
MENIFVLLGGGRGYCNQMVDYEDIPKIEILGLRGGHY